MAGQIVKRGDNTYQVRIFLGRVNGVKKFHTKTVHGTKRDAQAYATKVLRERDLGVFVQPTKETVGEFLDRWLETKVKVRARTLKDYRGLLERYVKPALGGVKLSQLGSVQIQKLVNALSESGLSPRTVKYAHDVLKMALGFAVKSGALIRNPCLLVELPRQRRPVAKSLTPEEARRFIAAAESDRYGALWLLLLQTGMRPGEALGLKWEDVDLDTRVLRIQRTLTRVDGSGWSFNDPKTDLSRRPVALGSTLAAALQRHRAQQAVERLREGPAYAKHGLVFATKQGEPLDYRVVVRRNFRPLLRRAEISDIRPYDLRHSSATLDILMGTPLKVVSERLGHSTIKMTLQTYQHVLPDMQASAANDFDRFLHSQQSPLERQNAEPLVSAYEVHDASMGTGN